MFTEITAADNSTNLAFTFEGRMIEARVGMTVAAALLAAGEVATRETPISGNPRGAYCLMGVCFECLVMIDGIANQQGCMVLVRDGMNVSRQLGVAVVSP